MKEQVPSRLRRWGKREPWTYSLLVLLVVTVYHGTVSAFSLKNNNHASPLRVREPGHSVLGTWKGTRSRPLTAFNLFQKDEEVLDQQQQQRIVPSSDLDAAALSEGDHIYQSALQRTALWVGSAFVFGTALGKFYGAETGEEFFAGYVLEQSLSVDNLLVFLLLFEYFRVPVEYQDRVLNWGIIGAIVMRAIMISAGAVAIHQFRPVLLVFAAILVYSSGKVLIGDGDDDGEEDFSENQIVKFSNSLINSTEKFDGDRFFTMVNGVKKATPLLLCMIAVEISDIVFAVDSIPAVFGVTENPIVVFTSNMFAIMGLRSLYTILSKAASELKYLEPAVAVVLGFIGVKMIAEYFGIDTPTELSLGVVLSLLGTGIGASIWEKRQEAGTQ